VSDPVLKTNNGWHPQVPSAKMRGYSKAPNYQTSNDVFRCDNTTGCVLLVSATTGNLTL